jgi:hypothetical protein
MKLSRSHAAPLPDLAAVMRFVDSEISKIVAEISASRPAKPARKPHRSRARTAHRHSHAA